MAAFVVARAVVFAASLHTGLGWPGAADLSRADSFNYLSIAAHGYVLHPCPPACLSGVDLPWSGNSGWFPLFPILVAPFSHLGVGATAGAVIAAVFEFVSFALLWFGFLRDIPRSRSLAILALACVFPGSIYYAAVFPISLFVALVLLGLIFIRRRQLPAATAVAFLVASAHPTGWVFAASAAWAVRSKLRSAMLPLAAAAAAVVLIFVAQWQMTGHWNAYLLSEKGRGDNGTNNPLHALSFAKAATLSYLHDPSRYDLVQYVQTMLVLVVVLVALAAFVVGRVRLRARLGTRPGGTGFILRRALSGAFDGSSAVAVFVGLAWLSPLVIGGASLYRTDATLLPALILFRRVPTFAVIALSVAAVPIAYLLDVRFFQGLLA